MIDLGLRGDRERLFAAIDNSREAARPFRQNRKKMIEEYAGSWYNGNAAKFQILVNLMHMAAEAYTIGLAAENPRVRISTPHKDLWPFAYRYRQAINNYIEEIRFAETHQDIVLDAFFSWGVAKIYQAEWESIQLEDDVWADPGRPYIGRISPDDFGLDMAVKDTRRCRFMWDEYRVSWESVRTNADFEKKVVKELSPNSKWDRGEEEAHDITSGTMTDDDDYESMIDLMDVWLPELNQIATFARHRRTAPLKVVDVGPEGGPYELLTFANVPDNVRPSSPAQNMLALHTVYNGLLRKQVRQAQRQKSNPAYRPASADDAKRLQRYGDGEWVKVNDPGGINVIEQGGVHQGNLAFSMNVFDLFDRQAGNLTAMLGLGAVAGTATQEQLIHQASSRKEAKMQNRDHGFLARCMKKLGHLMWADEFLNMPRSEELSPGTGVYVDMSWTPELREGDWWEYNFEIEPYSSNYQPPEAKLQKMDRLAAVIQQFFPIIQQSGGTIDMQEFLRDYGDLLQHPEADKYITFATPASTERPGPAAAEGAPKPPETTRNYVRRNVPTGGTQQSRSQVMQQALLNQSANGGQMASLSRAGA